MVFINQDIKVASKAVGGTPGGSEGDWDRLSKLLVQTSELGRRESGLSGPGWSYEGIIKKHPKYPRPALETTINHPSYCDQY